MSAAFDYIIEHEEQRLQVLRNIPAFTQVSVSNPCYSITGKFTTRWYSFTAQMEDTSYENVRNQFEIFILTGKLVFYGATEPFIIEMKVLTPFPEAPHGILVVVQIGAEEY